LKDFTLRFGPRPEGDAQAEQSGILSSSRESRLDRDDMPDSDKKIFIGLWALVMLTGVVLFGPSAQLTQDPFG
jgi:hypothetical protein